MNKTNVMILVLTFFLAVLSTVWYKKTVTLHNRLRNVEYTTVVMYSKLENIYNTPGPLKQKREQDIFKVLAIASNYNLAMTEDIAEAVVNASYRYKNLDINLICAVITHESAHTWDPNIVSPVGAIGLMQVMPTTGAAMAGELPEIDFDNIKETLRDPIKNITIGCHYLSKLIDRYDHIYAALAAYNGPHNRAWRFQKALLGKELDPHQYLLYETIRYIPAVMTLYENFVSFHIS